MQWLALLKRFAFLFAALFSTGLSAFYNVGGFLPGDAVDPQADLTQYSFSVPHALKSYGGSVAPSYRHTSHDGAGREINANDAGAGVFGYVHLQNLRIGVVSQNTAKAVGSAGQSLGSSDRVMVSYLTRILAFGAEAGGLRSTEDSPRDKWGATGALSASIYSYGWGIDFVWRISRPNGSAAAFQVFPDAAAGAIYQSAAYDTDIFSARWRYDRSFHWRSVLAANWVRSGYADSYAASNTWRYRANAMQVFFGLAWYSNFVVNTPGQLVTRTDQLSLPLAFALEQSRSVFYIGASSALFNRTMTTGDTQQSITLRFDPRIAYLYRFRQNLWAGFSLAEQGVTLREGSATPLRKEIRLSFQVTYNLAPFGYDDEVPFLDSPLLAMR